MNIQSVFLVGLRDTFTQLFMKRTFISLLLVAFAAHIIYYVTKRYLEHRVSGGSLNNSSRIVLLTNCRQMLLSVAATVASCLRSCHTDGLSDLTV